MTDALLLREQDRQEILRLLARHLPDVTAWAYGSRVNGGAHEGSDLDIVLRSPDLSPIPLEELRAFVQALRDSNIPILVEARDWARLPESFQREIMKNYVVLRETVSEWREINLGDNAFFKYGKMPEKTILGQGIYPIFSGYRYQDKYPECNCRKGDLIVVSRGVGGAGDVKIIKEDCYLTNLSIKIDLKPDVVENYFFYYFFLIENLKYLDSGSAQSQITINDLKKESFIFPPLHEQKAIASVLSSLDDKIDLLHRQNKTLEAMAEALFRQWFVEEAGEDLSSIPLSKIANFLNGLACQKYPPLNEIDRLPVLKIKELSSGITDSSDWVTNTVRTEYIVNNGDIIFSWSASLLVKIWNGGKCVINQHLFKVTSERFPKWFCYMWCKHHLDEFISISSSHATTMGHIKRCDLDNALVLVPKKQELEIMSSIMTPLIDKLITNQKQIRTLEQLRDTLLPKLMSGEVRVAC